jgi:SPX domain protein involved in polyphosphate accumulation
MLTLCVEQNYTGFVKIAKKFDKTLPDHKGMFKGNTCEDGMQAEVLAAKIVSGL